MIYLRFLCRLLLHKWFVLRAGRTTGVPLWRLLAHDWSKFSPAEFAAYARAFCGDYSNSPNDREEVTQEYRRAWLHHENANPHHWGHWIPRSGHYAGEPLAMPEIYVREMIADCLGASRAYTGSWDIAAWLNEHGSAWPLHDETVKLIAVVMNEIGYVLTDGCWSWRRKEDDGWRKPLGGMYRSI